MVVSVVAGARFCPRSITVIPACGYLIEKGILAIEHGSSVEPRLKHCKDFTNFRFLR